MTLWEFNGSLMVYSRIQSGKPMPMTDEEFDENLKRLRDLNLPDVKV